ncbi:TOBE domain-containing protein [Cupriavidus pauculus]|uniref:Molybdenum-dependent transcriptional regulator n=1 Tax=Cupriavidus pauculus TaxID=82633 RepID=A0A2N5CJS4_9BURK|nr:TOBE domain-containing protein [Cupriavidus pauculus]PLQ02461.1 molybdenum-dependent transcriptional regulator [Cupriavidus pauculus]
MLELQGAIWFRAGKQDWGGRDRIALLAAIGEHGSITAAARAVGISYKGAWDAIDAMNNSAGEPLVVRAAGGKGGGGTRLTERAARLIATYRAMEAEHARFIAHLERAGAMSDANPEDIHLIQRMMIQTSARNKLFGRVEAVRAGAVNDEVTLALPGGLRIVSTITHESVETLGLVPGAEAFALVKASSVLIGLPDPAARLSARNQLPGKVARVVPGAVNAEVVLELDGGGTVAAIINNGALTDLDLKEGARALAIFKASSVILGTMI